MRRAINTIPRDEYNRLLREAMHTCGWHCTCIECVISWWICFGNERRKDV